VAVKYFLFIQNFIRHIFAAEVEINYFRDIFKAYIGVLKIIDLSQKETNAVLFLTSGMLVVSEISSLQSLVDDDLLNIFCKFLLRAFNVDNGLRKPLMKAPASCWWTGFSLFCDGKREKYNIFLTLLLNKYLCYASADVGTGSSPGKWFVRSHCNTMH
jgi:hypothetical protein